MATVFDHPDRRVLGKFGLSADTVNFDLWQKFSVELEAVFREDPLRMRRIHCFYLPVCFWILETIRKSGKESGNPFGGGFLLGINGPQGAGKSTLSRVLCELLSNLSLKVLTVSIDDFYLRREEQVKIAGEFLDNPYLQQRGYPGTHDLTLGERTIRALKNGSVGESVYVPKYEKSLFQGKGDRLPEDQWQVASPPLDILILEGWMLGFSPVPPEKLPDRHFMKINELLKGYSIWSHQIDGFIHMEAEDTRFILDWRVEAEMRMKAEGKTGMSAEEIKNYIRMFLPAYETYVPGLVLNPPAPCALHLCLGKDRLPILDF